MVRTTLKSILGHKARLAMTALSVVLGVALMAGTLVLTDTVGKTFDDLVADIYRDTETVVRTSETYEDAMGGEEHLPVDAAVLDDVRATPGVATAEGIVQGYAQVVGTDGGPVGEPNTGAPTYGMNWLEEPALNPFTLVEGSAPSSGDEVVLVKGTADDAGVTVGDTVTVLSATAPRQMTVSGVATFGDVDSPGGASILLFTLDTTRALVGLDGQFSEIVVDGRSGVGEAELTAAVAERLPTGTEAITGSAKTAEDQSEFQRQLGFFNTFLLTFAGIALFVGAFIISNTFSIIVAQRTRELALLRAVGASRRQVLGSLVGEAVAVGVVASAVGLVLGIGVAIGLQALLGGLGFDIPATSPVITPTSMGIAFAVGTLITLLSAVLPARRASRIPPLAALADVSIDASATSRTRIVSGGVITALGALALVAGLNGGGAAMVGLGAAVVFVGIAVLGPVIARPVARLLAAPLPALRGVTGRIARENATRNPKRTASTASALMVGVGLVAFITIFAASARASLNQAIDGSLTSDLVVAGSGPISPTLADELRQVPELDSVTSLRFATMQVDGSSTNVYASDTATIGDIADPEVSEGSFEAVDGDGIAVSRAVADDKGLSIGSPLTVDLQGERTYTVEAIYEDDTLLEGYVLDLSAFEAAVPDSLDVQLFLKAADGVPVEDARTAVEAVAAPYPTAEVQDMSQYKSSMSAQIDQLLNLIYALLMLAVLIALIGIANTLALSIFERTRELGLLRAVGMSRAQVRSSIRWESVIIALFGTALGLGIGLFFGWALVQALSSEGIDVLSVPVGNLAVVVVLAAVAGVVAALGPARRAARLQVLDAVSAD